jgi:hypothetical protein
MTRMNDTLHFILVVLGIGILLLIPSMLLQLWLFRNGVIRNGLLSIIPAVFIAVLIQQLWFVELS